MSQDVKTALDEAQGWLGCEIRDVVSGARGICTSVNLWLNGCVRVSISPPCKKGGKETDDIWVDWSQVVVESWITEVTALISHNAVQSRIAVVGGPANDPPKVGQR